MGSMRRRYRLGFGLVVLLYASLALHSCASTKTSREVRPGYSERGRASWYGPGFHGRDTASGERYDMHAHTAAHRSLPFHTLVEVRNRDNGKKTRVRINDRGPFVRGRIIDLSYSAALDLDMVGPGTARVEVRVLESPGHSIGRGRYWLQVGAFQDPDLAKQLRRELRGRVSDVQILSEGSWHRVQVGPFRSRKKAETAQRDLRRMGYDSVLKLI